MSFPSDWLMMLLFDDGEDHHRWLQMSAGNSRGRSVLTILYLILLGLCFIVPILYYLRMHCEDRRARLSRELELVQILEVSREHRDETRAARRKYREEKRARILQLFGPVQKVLQASDFTDATDDIESGERDEDGNATSSLELPVPGFFKTEMRPVSSTCAICLGEYEAGDDVVWSSNPSCDHVFHSECIERWLLKQRGRPLCPCCRRDFVVDPLDEDEEDHDRVVPLEETDSYLDNLYVVETDVVPNGSHEDNHESESS